jgi:hypothetical protein
MVETTKVLAAGDIFRLFQDRPAPSWRALDFSDQLIISPFSLNDGGQLDDAWAARPLELVRERGRTMLVLADPGGQPLDQLVEVRSEIGRFSSCGGLFRCPW